VSISSTFYTRFFCTSVLHSFSLITVWLLKFFGANILAQKLLIKCWWNWLQEDSSNTFTMIQFRLNWWWITWSSPLSTIPTRNWRWKPSRSSSFFCPSVSHSLSLLYVLKEESTKGNWQTQGISCPLGNKWRRRESSGNGRWHFDAFVTLRKLFISCDIETFCDIFSWSLRFDKFRSVYASNFECVFYLVFHFDNTYLVSISSTFYVPIFLYKHWFGSFFYVHVTRGKLPKQCSYEKFVCKMLMKLTACFKSNLKMYHNNVNAFENRLWHLCSDPVFKQQISKNVVKLFLICRQSKDFISVGQRPKLFLNYLFFSPYKIFYF